MCPVLKTGFQEVDLDDVSLSYEEWETYQDAAHCIDSFQYTRAIQLMSPIVEAHPEAVSLNLLYVQVLMANYQYKEAWAAVAELLETYPNNTEALYRYCCLCDDRCDLIRYKRTLKRLVEQRDPTNLYYLLLAKSRFLQDKKDFEGQYRMLLQAQQLLPAGSSPLPNLLVPMIKTRRLEEAERIAIQLLTENPDDYATLNSLADIAWERREIERAETLLKKAQAIWPSGWAHPGRLTRIYWYRGEIHKVWGTMYQFIRALRS